VTADYTASITAANCTDTYTRTHRQTDTRGTDGQKQTDIMGKQTGHWQ